jgi:hypothetical protein
VCREPFSSPRQREKGGIRDLTGSLIAVNAWGNGAEEFIAKIRDHGVQDWRIRYCGDTATALELARNHGHAAFVARSAAALVDGVIEVPLPGLRKWVIELDLLYLRSNREDPVVKAVTEAAPVRKSSTSADVGGPNPGVLGHPATPRPPQHI